MDVINRMGKCHDEIVRKFVESPLTKVMNNLTSAEVMRVVEKPIGNPATWEFPAASVSVVELKLT